MIWRIATVGRCGCSYLMPRATCPHQGSNQQTIRSPNDNHNAWTPRAILHGCDVEGVHPVRTATTAAASLDDITHLPRCRDSGAGGRAQAVLPPASGASRAAGDSNMALALSVLSADDLSAGIWSDRLAVARRSRGGSRAAAVLGAERTQLMTLSSRARPAGAQVKVSRNGASEAARCISVTSSGSQLVKTMVQRLTYRKRHSYATKSNQTRVVKTPGEGSPSALAPIPLAASRVLPPSSYRI